MPSRRHTLAAALAAVLTTASLPALAQEPWPSQPVKLVVPYAAGGSTDLIGRRLAERLSRELGQPVIVDNRPGAGTNVGAAYVAGAKNDGHTLLLGSFFQVLNPIFGPKPSFELGTGLEPVSLVAIAPYVLAANPQTPYNDGKSVVAAAKAKPRALSVAHAQMDVPLALLNHKAGTEFLAVPYKGGGPAATDAMSGQVNMVFTLVPAVLPHIQAGKLKPLAVTSAERFPGLPDVPSFAESGVDVDIQMWYGLFTPAGTPKPVVERLAAATRKIASSKEMIESLRGAGANSIHSSPEEFRAKLRKETGYWQGVAKAIPNLVH